MAQKARWTRRQFLEETMLIAAAGGAVSTPATAASPGRESLVEIVRVAVIGVGGRGAAHAREFSRLANCQVSHVCDADRARAEHVANRLEREFGRRPQVEVDVRHVLDAPGVDAISTATPNHWHALVGIWAMQAGKDAYIEKPVSHNVAEGRQLVAAARAHGRICQGGTQYRGYGDVRSAIEFLRTGGIGDLSLARCICHKRRKSIGKSAPQIPPDTVDYDLWVGPAQMQPPVRERFHYDWHWFWNYGNGELGNSSIHRVDLARWALGVDGLGKSVISVGGRVGYDDAAETPNTQFVIHDFGEQTIVQEVRGLAAEPYRGIPNGVLVVGTEGYLALTPGSSQAFDRDGQPVQSFQGPNENHFANFLAAVRSGDRSGLNADIEKTHVSSALCHIGNISHRLGQSLPVDAVREALEQQGRGDVATEVLDRTLLHLKANGVAQDHLQLTLGTALQLDGEHFVGEHAALAEPYLSRSYRAPFVVSALG